MPQVDLSSLSGSELRALLNTTRERGEAAQSYRILQEMAARRGDKQVTSDARRPPEPRIIEVDHSEPVGGALSPDEPADFEDDVPPLPPNWKPTPPAPPVAQSRRKVAARPAPKAAPRPAPKAAPAPAPRVAVKPPPKPAPKPAPKVAPAAPEPPPPIAAVQFRDVVTDDDSAPLAWDLPPPTTAPEHRPRARHTAAILVAGLVVGIGLGVVVGDTFRAPPHQPTVAAFRAAATPMPPPQRVETAVQTPPPYPELPAEPDPAPPDSAQPAATPPETAQPETTPAETPQASGCAALSTPADRTICGDAELRRLQRELRQAYARALAAHRDRDLLREHQLAWANARDGVSDPHALARLYEQRIRKLNAATADARRKG